jgi:hypothetical protein
MTTCTCRAILLKGGGHRLPHPRPGLPKTSRTRYDTASTQTHSVMDITQYIILNDTYGYGLKEVSCLGLDPIELKDLPAAICNTVEEILETDSDEEFSEVKLDDYLVNRVVICELSSTIGNISTNLYVRNVLKKRQEELNLDEYENYLRLKEKFQK